MDNTQAALGTAGSFWDAYNALNVNDGFRDAYESSDLEDLPPPSEELHAAYQQMLGVAAEKGLAGPEAAEYAFLAAVSPEVDNSFGGALANSLDQPLEGIGITLEALGADGAGKWLRDLTETPENYQSASAEFMNEDGRFYDFSYFPRAVVEQAGQFAGSVLSRGAGALIGGGLGAAGGSVIPGVGSAAGGATGAAAGALLGPALFEGMQILGPVALQRAENNGRSKPNAEDWSVAFATASASGAMNSIAPGAQGILRRALLEGGTEAVQAIIQQSGETALTDIGLDVNLREAVGEGILGAGSAGLVDTTTTAIDRAVSSDMGQAFIKEEDGIFGGRRAKDPTHDALNRPNPTHIGADGKWRFEIDDSQATVDVSQVPVVDPKTDTGGVPLADVIDHPELFRQYPHLENINVTFDENLGELELGYYSKSKNRIALNPGLANDPRLKPILLHEIQHPPQDYEGFDGGTTTKHILETKPEPVQALADQRYERELPKARDIQTSYLQQKAQWENYDIEGKSLIPFHNAVIDLAETYNPENPWGEFETDTPMGQILDSIKELTAAADRVKDGDLVDREVYRIKVKDFVSSFAASAQQDPIIADKFREVFRGIEPGDFLSLNDIRRFEFLEGLGVSPRQPRITLRDTPDAEVLTVDAFEAYQRKGGEVEGRNVETRSDYTYQQRMDTPPEQTMDRTPEQIWTDRDANDRTFLWAADDPYTGELLADTEQYLNSPGVKGDAAATIDPNIKMPNYRVDNPGGRWLAEKVATAEQRMSEAHSGPSGKGLTGSTTAYLTEPVQLPVGLLKNLRGAMDEKPAPGNGKWDAIQNEFNEVGWRQDRPIAIGVNHKGQAFILEGNNRVAVAAANGVDKIPAEIRWYNGAEEARGPFNPANIAKMTKTKGPTQDDSGVKPQPVPRFKEALGKPDGSNKINLQNPEVAEQVISSLKDKWTSDLAEADEYPAIARSARKLLDMTRSLEANPDVLGDFLSVISTPQDTFDTFARTMTYGERQDLVNGVVSRHQAFFDELELTPYARETLLIRLAQKISHRLARLKEDQIASSNGLNYRPRIPEVLDSFEWPKGGLTGAQFLKILADSPSIRQSEVRSLDLDIDPQARYSKNEITQMLSDKLWNVYADRSTRWNNVQRQTGNADTQVEYFAYNIDAHRNGRTFQTTYGKTHFNPNTVAHVRASVRERPDGTQYILVEELQSDLLQAGYKPATSRPISAEEARQSFLDTHQPLVDNLEALGADNDLNLSPEQKEMLPASVEFIRQMSSVDLDYLRYLGHSTTRQLAEKYFIDNLLDITEDSSWEQRDSASRKKRVFIDFAKKHINSILSQVTDEPISTPPVTKTEETVRLALDSLIYEAAQQGITEIRIPSLERLVEQRFEPGSGKYDGALDPKSGFYATYVTALEKVLKEYEKDLGAKVYDAPLRYFDTPDKFDVKRFRDSITPTMAEWPADEQSFENYLLDDILQDILAVNTDGRGITMYYGQELHGLHPPVEDVGNWEGPLDVEEVASIEDLLENKYPEILDSLFDGSIKSIREYMKIEESVPPRNMSKVLDLSDVDFDKIDVSRPGFAKGGLVDKTYEAFGLTNA